MRRPVATKPKLVKLPPPTDAPIRVSRRGVINEGNEPLLTASQFRVGADAYFAYCDNRIKTIVDEDGNGKTFVVPEPYTKEGLAVFLTKLAGKFVSRHEIHRWGKGETQGKNDPALSQAVKESDERIDADCMRRVNESKTPTGAIYYSKAALGYRDVQSLEVGGMGGKDATVALRIVNTPATGGQLPSREKATAKA